MIGFFFSFACSISSKKLPSFANEEKSHETQKQPILNDFSSNSFSKFLKNDAKTHESETPGINEISSSKISLLDTELHEYQNQIVSIPAATLRNNYYIYRNCTVTLIGCHFENCGFELIEEGMITLKNSKILIEKCSFTDCIGQKGIVNAFDCPEVEVLNTNFTTNLVTDDGGCINGMFSNINCKNCIFYGNSARASGGVFYFTSCDCDISRVGCIYNEAEYETSVAVFEECKNINLKKVHFIYNKVLDVAEQSFDECSVVSFVDCNNAHLDGCQFFGNMQREADKVFSICAIGASKINAHGIAFDDLDYSFFEIPDSENLKPNIVKEHIYAISQIPRKYAPLIEEKSDQIQKIKVHVDQNNSLSYVSAIITGFTFLILIVVGGLYIIVTNKL